jgi:UDP-N-acetylglucosamine 2-epimerase (non-hydrolysing)
VLAGDFIGEFHREHACQIAWTAQSEAGSRGGSFFLSSRGTARLMAIKLLGMVRAKIVTIIGTRPEGIKMAPVVLELRRRAERFEQLVVATGQHREMLEQVLAPFEIRPDVNLELMQPGQDPAEFAARAIAALARLFADEQPAAVLLQGDTTTVMSAAIAGCYRKVAVGHVEAGLRSFDRRNPFPEEINRRIAGCLADFHFAPTTGARDNLLREGIPKERIFVTGNTIVDALQSIHLDGPFENEKLSALHFGKRRMLLVTAHRRENHGEPLADICQALKALAARFDDVEIVYPVHLNPNVRGLVTDVLGSVPRIHLLEPVSYGDLLRLMQRCCFILTDSGGIQEEAPSFKKPVLILRDVTERPEVVEVGAGKIVGTQTERVVAEASRLLTDPAAYSAMASADNPFGDGHAAERIADALESML